MMHPLWGVSLLAIAFGSLTNGICPTARLTWCCWESSFAQPGSAIGFTGSASQNEARLLESEDRRTNREGARFPYGVVTCSAGQKSCFRRIFPQKNLVKFFTPRQSSRSSGLPVSREIFLRAGLGGL